MRLFPREAVKATKDLLRLFPVVAVIGARQAGKTTLCSVVGDKWKQYDLERESDYRLLQEDPLFFLQQNPERVIIDEAQELPSLFPALRVAVDAHRGKRGRYLITGSSSPDLLSSIAETLAGRIGVLELPTLKATEAWRKKSPAFTKSSAGKSTGLLWSPCGRSVHGRSSLSHGSTGVIRNRSRFAGRRTTTSGWITTDPHTCSGISVVSFPAWITRHFGPFWGCWPE